MLEKHRTAISASTLLKWPGLDARYCGTAEEEKEEDKGAIGISRLSDCSFDNIFSTALVIPVNWI
jgi:hypothetical protein